MGRLDDIIERNKRGHSLSPGALIISEVRDTLDPRQPLHVRKRKAIAMAITLMIVAAAVVGFLVWFRGRDAARREAASEVIDPSGRRVSLSSVWRERPAIVVFYSLFASEGCEAQLRELRELGREHGAAVAAVAFDTYGIEPLREALGSELPLYVAASRELIDAWEIPWTHSDYTGPAIYLIARGGEVTYHTTCRAQVHCSIRAELAPAFAPSAKSP